MVTTRPPKTIVKPTARGPVANTDTKLLIYGLFQKRPSFGTGRGVGKLLNLYTLFMPRMMSRLSPVHIVRFDQFGLPIEHF